MHIFMLGDSVFDNAAYVRRGKPDVRKQVAELPTWSNHVPLQREMLE
jgi:hypothetical protein